MPFVVCVPAADRTAFEPVVNVFAGSRLGLQLVTDAELLGQELPQSWGTQQVVKLHAWRLGFAEAFLVVDSDFRFVRDFGPQDFLTAQGEVRWVLSRRSHDFGPAWRGEGRPVGLAEGRALAVPASRWGSLSPTENLLNRIFGFSYVRRPGRVRRVFKRRGPDFHCMPGPVWTSRLGAAFFADFLQPRGLSARDVIRYCPWEALWMTEFALALGLPGLVPAEPYFLSFSSPQAVSLAHARGLTVAALPAHYLGVVVAAEHCPEDLVLPDERPTRDPT